MKILVLIAFLGAISVVLLPNGGNCVSLFGDESPRSSFIARVRFTIRNLTSNWIIPGIMKPNSGLNTRIKTTTVRPRPAALVTAPAKTKLKSTTAKITTTTTTTPTPPPQLPFINIVESIMEIECSPASCESDDIHVLEKCEDFCLHFVMNASGSPANSQAHDKTASDHSHESTTVAPTGTCADDSDSKCTCHYDLAPVCGSNGHTYANFCELECAQKCTAGLKLVHNGSCEKRRKEIWN